MQAVVITAPGGVEVLELREVARPAPSYGQVLVRVHATALNRADILQRQGRYPPPSDAPSDIPGMEFAGGVAELGAGVTRWKRGQRVFGIVGGGAYTEYLVSHERMLAEIPSKLSYVEAAAIPESFITAHDALVTQASLRASETVLIHAVASGVGLAAVQLVRALLAIPFGTARGSGKIDRAREYGLEDGWAATEDFTELTSLAKRWSGGSRSRKRRRRKTSPRSITSPARSTAAGPRFRSSFGRGLPPPRKSAPSSRGSSRSSASSAFIAASWTR